MYVGFALAVRRPAVIRLQYRVGQSPAMHAGPIVGAGPAKITAVSLCHSFLIGALAMQKPGSSPKPGC
jgi:hypothetical protein